MLVALFYGDVISAFYFNPVLFCLLPYLVLVLAGGISKKVARWEITKFCYTDKMVFTVIAIFCIWGIIRNIVL